MLGAAASLGDRGTRRGAGSGAGGAHIRVFAVAPLSFDRRSIGPNHVFRRAASAPRVEDLAQLAALDEPEFGYCPAAASAARRRSSAAHHSGLRIRSHS